MIAQVRIRLFECMDLSGQVADLVGFRQTKIQIPAGDIVKRNKLPLDPVRHADQVLRTVPQKHALIGQFDIKTLPDEQFFPQFFLQGFQGL